MSTPGVAGVVVEELGEGMMLVRADNPARLLCLGGPSNDARVQALEAIVTAKEAELERLETRAHEAVEEQKLWEQQHGVQWERAEEAETEVARLKEFARGIADALKESIERTDSDLHSLALAKTIIGAHNVNVGKLATATALLREHQHLATVHYTNAGCDLAHRTEAFLAGQPAAPECRCDLGAVNCELHRLGAPEPATPARTEAERAVLEAMSRVDIVEVKGSLPYMALGRANAAAALAELARRRLE